MMLLWGKVLIMRFRVERKKLKPRQILMSSKKITCCYWLSPIINAHKINWRLPLKLQFLTTQSDGGEKFLWTQAVCDTGNLHPLKWMHLGQMQNWKQRQRSIVFPLADLSIRAFQSSNLFTSFVSNPPNGRRGINFFSFFFSLLFFFRCRKKKFRLVVYVFVWVFRWPSLYPLKVFSYLTVISAKKGKK